MKVRFRVTAAPKSVKAGVTIRRVKLTAVPDIRIPKAEMIATESLSARLEMTVDNPSFIDHFIGGRDFMVEITPVDSI